MTVIHHVRVHRSEENLAREDQLAYKIAQVAADPVAVEADVVDMIINRVIDNAAVAAAALTRGPVVAARAQVARIYRDRLAHVPGLHLPPPLPANVVPNHAYQPVEIDGGEARCDRDAICGGLKKYNVYARRYFHPLLTACAPYRNAKTAGELPVARRVARQILTLPIHHDLAPESVHRICDMLLHLLSGSA